MDEYCELFEQIGETIHPEKDEKNRVVNKIFNYGNFRGELFEAYNDFFLTAQTLAKTTRNMGYLRSDVIFYFSTYDKIDAFGGIQRSSGQAYVIISHALFEAMHSFCNEISEPLNDFSRKNGLVIDQITKVRAKQFLFSIASTYLYFHELGHVIQAEGDVDLDVSNSDNTSNNHVNPYDERSHMRELDADQFATRMICLYMLNYFDNGLDDELRTPHRMAELTAFTLLGISVLFHVLSNNLTRPFHLTKGSHPHHSIRIKNSLEIFNDIFKKNLIEVDEDRLLDLYARVYVRVFKSASSFVNHLFQPEPIMIVNDLGETVAAPISPQVRAKEIEDYLVLLFERTLTDPNSLLVRRIPS
ncbi:hypothetical protein [Dyadobacter sp. 3J3]|uniref:hypothetical protein n=1 Tax=Dyadobacter sp. 3J3 TaxID=2606600 RepID=UPI0013587B90|nr:hypothetical protein [Dyadobacter sp. 3J3]